MGGGVAPVERRRRRRRHMHAATPRDAPTGGGAAREPKGHTRPFLWACRQMQGTPAPARASSRARAMSGKTYVSPYAAAPPGSSAEFMGIDKMLQRRRVEKIAQAEAARDRLTRFEKLADPNNDEMQRMIKEVRSEERSVAWHPRPRPGRSPKSADC